MVAVRLYIINQRFIIHINFRAIIEQLISCKRSFITSLGIGLWLASSLWLRMLIHAQTHTSWSIMKHHESWTNTRGCYMGGFPYRSHGSTMGRGWHTPRVPNPARHGLRLKLVMELHRATASGGRAGRWGLGMWSCRWPDDINGHWLGMVCIVSLLI